MLSNKSKKSTIFTNPGFNLLGQNIITMVNHYSHTLAISYHYQYPIQNVSTILQISNSRFYTPKIEIKDIKVACFTHLSIKTTVII